MADLQVVFLRDIMPVSRVEPLDSSIPSLRISGRNFRAASAVLINGIESPAFLSVSNSQLLAEIPSSIVGDLVRSVAVLSNRITSTDRSVLSFRISGSSSKVRGILRLVQRFVLMLLASPGSDILNPSVGGGLTNLVGKVITGSQRSNIQSAVQQIVSKTASDLKRIQAESDALTESETLASATLATVVFDPSTTTLAIRVSLVAANGQDALANLFV
ncbi:MAG: hypothetical protein KDB07_03990 [Planctomycetes bacterium]|nr:hypothetical protein [Planctomycetota bacterium]